ncbi:MAG TPA: serine/threonine-protein kinase [Labilithrix sp.]|nr:serine/threonine-protein kinase [Labilithrix sp.]
MLDDRAIAGLRALVAEPGAGDVLGDRFELREVIGEGGMGVVHGAWDREREREVAIKVLRATGEDDRARFDRERGALEGASHSCLVPYVASGTHQGVHWVAMDRLHGSTLAQRLLRGPLGIADTVALGRRIADALASVHRQGITHRDVKPSNVFLVDDAPANVRLLDFGIARDAAAATLTRTGALVGTPGYMAPEQARGEKATPAADVFALGCVLFECLTGRPAFAGESVEIVLAQIMLEAPPLVRTLRPEVPLALEGLVEQMLDKQVAMRPTAEVVERELAALESYLPTERGAGAPAEPAPGFAEGALIGGKYRVEERIGEGGMGIVVAARHLELGKRVALKLLRRSDGTDVPRFLREAQAASRLESEHVARVLDVGRTADGTPYIVMEHLKGSDLAKRLALQGSLPFTTAVGYVLEAGEAIAEAHALGIVHRDLKPSNLFVVARRDGTELVKVLDFGIVKVTRPLDGASASASMTGASAVIGSASYMSPEQLHDSKTVDARTDIWALGVVLHELITGSRPFEGESAAAVGARIAAVPPRRLRELVPDAPAALEKVILTCLEKDPAKRFANLSLLAAALAPFAGEGHRVSVDRIRRMVGEPLPSAPRASAAAPRRTEGAAPLGAGALAAVLGLAMVISGLVSIVTLGKREEPSPPVSAVAPPRPLPAPLALAPPSVASPPSAAPPAPPPPTVAPPPRALPLPSARAPSPRPSSRPARDLDLRDPALEGR